MKFEITYMRMIVPQVNACITNSWGGLMYDDDMNIKPTQLLIVYKVMEDNNNRGEYALLYDLTEEINYHELERIIKNHYYNIEQCNTILDFRGYTFED